MPTSPVDVSHYTYRVTWSSEDEEFVATCAELPSLSWLDASPEEALRGLRRLVLETVAEMEDAGESVPVPFSERPSSGKFNLRVGERLHRELVTQAAEERLSLNQYVVRRLTASP